VLPDNLKKAKSELEEVYKATVHRTKRLCKDDAEGDVAKGADKHVDCTSKTRAVIGRFTIAYVSHVGAGANERWLYSQTYGVKSWAKFSSRRIVPSTCHLVVSTHRIVVSTRRLVTSTCRLVVSCFQRSSCRDSYAILNTEKTKGQKKNQLRKLHELTRRYSELTRRDDKLKGRDDEILSTIWRHTG